MAYGEGLYSANTYQSRITIVIPDEVLLDWETIAQELFLYFNEDPPDQADWNSIEPSELTFADVLTESSDWSTVLDPGATILEST